jgi:hypothetical protein
MSASCCCGPGHAFCSLSFHARYRLKLFCLRCKCWRGKLGFSPVYVEATWLSRPRTVGAWAQLIVLLGWRDIQSIAVACLSRAPALFARVILPAHFWGRHDATLSVAATPRVLRGGSCCCRNSAAWSCKSVFRKPLGMGAMNILQCSRRRYRLVEFLHGPSRDTGTPRRMGENSKTHGVATPLPRTEYWGNRGSGPCRFESVD